MPSADSLDQPEQPVPSVAGGLTASTESAEGQVSPDASAKKKGKRKKRRNPSVGGNQGGADASPPPTPPPAAGGSGGLLAGHPAPVQEMPAAPGPLTVSSPEPGDAAPAARDESPEASGARAPAGVESTPENANLPGLCSSGEERTRTVIFTEFDAGNISTTLATPPQSPAARRQQQQAAALAADPGASGRLSPLEVAGPSGRQVSASGSGRRKSDKKRSGSVMSMMSFAESPRVADLPEGSVAADERQQLSTREVYLNDPEKTNVSAGGGLPSNFLKTSHYTLLNFLPLNLFMQFHQISNCYFLLNMVIALIPGVSPITPITAVVPLVLVLTVAACKDGYEDWKRHVSDAKDNAAPVRVLKHDGWQTVKSMDVRVGDILRLTRGDAVKADVVVLSSDDDDGVVYIETSQLDGETNVKPRKGRPETLYLKEPKDFSSGTDPDSFGVCGITMTVDAPNDKLYRWNGVLNLESGEAHPLTTKQVIWRGSSVKKTTWAHAVVIYTGPQTKQGMNLKVKGRKTSELVKKLNVLILVIFTIKHVFIFILCSLGVAWANEAGGHWYLEYWVDKFSGAARFGLNYLTFFILFSFLIPISLFVTIEAAKAVQIVLMRWDHHMFYHMKTSATGEGELFTCRPKTSDLNEQLAAVRYIFTDKTGTLTENIMQYTEGVVGSQTREDGGMRQWVQHYEHGSEQAEVGSIDVSGGGNGASAVFDGNVGRSADGLADDVGRYLACMALCHTVVPFQEPDGSWVFEGASPDEVALVRAAHQNNFSLRRRTSKEATISVRGQQHVYEVVEELEFTPTRKMMSIVLRDAGGLTFLLTKGADASVLPRLVGAGHEAGERHDMVDINPDDQRHLDLLLKGYASRGLRTLCFAWRPLEPTEFQQWHAAYKMVQCSMEKTDAMVDEACLRLESNVMLTGVCAYEDKLQEGVPETVRFFVDAGVVVWMLTGDKLETGIEIGRACGLAGPLGPVSKVLRKKKGQDLGVRVVETFSRHGADMLVVAAVMPHSAAEEAGVSKGMAICRVNRCTVTSVASFADCVAQSGEEVEIECQERPDDVAEILEVHINKELAHDRTLRDDPSLEPNEREARRQRQVQILQDKMTHAMEHIRTGRRVAMAIDGVSLDIALGDECLHQFIELAKVIYSGICCRLTPAQKGRIVDMFQKESGETALAIGDGANDATMIGVARVGIGIIGLEGSQAEHSSDYAIPRFRHLRRLVAVHGRYSLYRNAMCACFSFYKNLVLTMGQVYFAASSGYSGRTLFDSWLLAVKNTLFTFLPPLFMGCFEKDIAEEVLMDPVAGPQLFKELASGKYFDTRSICMWFGVAFAHGTLLYWFAFPTMQLGDVDGGNGHTHDLYHSGTLILSGVVYTVLAKGAIHLRNFDSVQGMGILVSAVFYIAFIAVYSSIPKLSLFGSVETHYYQIAHGLFGDAKYWLYLILTSWGLVGAMDFAFLAAQRMARPSLRDLWQVLYDYKPEPGKRPIWCCSGGASRVAPAPPSPRAAH